MNELLRAQDETLMAILRMWSDNILWDYTDAPRLLREYTGDKGPGRALFNLRYDIYVALVDENADKEYIATVAAQFISQYFK